MQDWFWDVGLVIPVIAVIWCKFKEKLHYTLQSLLYSCSAIILSLIVTKILSPLTLTYYDKGYNINNTSACQVLSEWNLRSSFLRQITCLMRYGGEISCGTSWWVCQITRWFIQDVLNTLLLRKFQTSPKCLLSLCKLNVTSKSAFLAALFPFRGHFQECEIISVCV